MRHQADRDLQGVADAVVQLGQQPCLRVEAVAQRLLDAQAVLGQRRIVAQQRQQPPLLLVEGARRASPETQRAQHFIAMQQRHAQIDLHAERAHETGQRLIHLLDIGQVQRLSLAHDEAADRHVHVQHRDRLTLGTGQAAGRVEPRDISVAPEVEEYV